MSNIQSHWQLLLEELCSTENRVELPSTLDNKGRVKACYFDEKVYDTLLKWLIIYSKQFRYKKNEEEAAESRRKGNGLYTKGDAVQSLIFYTKAIFLAPKGSEELKLAFGNRSAAFFSLEKYEESISDIKYALSSDDLTLSTVSRDVRLLVRKAKALEKLQKFSEAVVTYQLAKKIFLRCNCEEEEKLNHLQQDIDRGLNELQNSKISKEKVSSSECKEDKFNMLMNNFVTDAKFPSASSKLGLMKNDKKGRYVIAKENIAPGEILFLEKPFAFVILPEFAYEHCQACCKYLINPIPCKHCSEACFCNEECRRLAWNKFHKWECGFGLDLNYMIGIAHLGFRVAIVGFTNPNSLDYEKVRNLEQHISSMEPDDVLQYSLTATVLVIYLEKFTKLFMGPNRMDSLFEFGGSILHHIAQMICNGHAITELSLAQGEGSEIIADEEQVRVATAIYPSASMMNHSCDPSIINGFKDQYLIVRAIKEIHEGEEVYNCYGPHFRRMEREERINSLLQQYMFYCDCEQCNSEEDFIQRFIGYRCRSKHCDGAIPLREIKCPKCFMMISDKCCKSIKKAKEKMDSAKYAALCNDYQKSVDLANIALKSYFKYLYKHHKLILECRDFLSKMLISLGRCYESYVYIEENLIGIKERFGSNSIEVANETAKLADIGLNLLNLCIDDRGVKQAYPLKFNELFKRLSIHLKEALEIVKIHYGETSQKYLDLENQKNTIESVTHQLLI